MHLSDIAEPPARPTQMGSENEPLVPDSNFLFHWSFSIDQTGLMARMNRLAIRLPTGDRYHVDATEQITIPA